MMTVLLKNVATEEKVCFLIGLMCKFEKGKFFILKIFFNIYFKKIYEV